ncbi:MAG: hypothetical protein CMG01_06210 [Candidatus Marinimicrobia bacterium]|nr:hypothetical protein [Candidatus Neomarinimicrobiota bacterium]|tara:strand:- start:22362 stop:23597 length:1236 start_codon:yes stop_codon:yes gene_type:complete
MLNKFVYISIILCISLIGADRINLMSQAFEFFVFTPYLLLSLLILFTLFLFNRDYFDFKWLLNNNIFLLFFLIYIVTCIISIFFSIDIYISIKRFILLIYLLLSSIIIQSYFKNNQELLKVLIKSSLLGSFIFFIFNFLLLLNWFSDFDFSNSYINLEPDKLAYFLPRLGGYSMDSNRGGIILFFFTFVLFFFGNKNKLNSSIIILNILFLFLSFSRTIYLLLIMVFLFQLLISEKEIKKNMLKKIFYSLIFFLLIIGFLTFNQHINLYLAFQERIDIFEISRFSSAGIHLKLILEGFAKAFNDFKILFFGSGFGTSFLLIKGYYWSGIKYGNYHSLYITTLVECGIFNTISMFIISFLLPFIIDYKNHIFTLLFGLLFFNIFYQLIMEPVFWFSILLFYKFNFSELKNEK